ncbi:MULTISPECIES: hypothetical protein [unclassified Bradyrhizobium]|uniref:hypothetical protein n=1 Tax=Bradyrhizobium sp. USDA 4541 TaxID=2817704 RepID=UPI0020A2E06C|nr:hypothetical protein [Bradyrhizobium sp. USDA 4541]MCP1848372.1 hypothetical protein [Bradyrhizobium sp. USDA 4541]
MTPAFSTTLIFSIALNEGHADEEFAQILTSVRAQNHRADNQDTKDGGPRIQEQTPVR